MKAVFPGTHGPSSHSGESDTSHEAVVTKADRLSTELRSNPTDRAAGKSSVARRWRRKHTSNRPYQRNSVVIDYPGHSPTAVQVFHDYDKVLEGTMVLTALCLKIVLEKKFLAY